MTAPTFTLPGGGQVVFYMGDEGRLTDMATAFEAAWLKLPPAAQKFIATYWKGLAHKRASAIATVGLDPELSGEWPDWECLESNVDWIMPASAWPTEDDHAQRRTMLMLFAHVINCAMFSSPGLYFQADSMYYQNFSEDLAIFWETGTMPTELWDALTGLEKTVKACKAALKVYKGSHHPTPRLYRNPPA